MIIGLGTLINVITILVGSALGIWLGSRLPERVRQTVIAGLGLFTLCYGLSMFLKTQNSLIVLGSLLVGALLGEWWKIEDGVKSLGGWLEHKFLRQNRGEQTRFVRGFMTTSLVYCIGPVAILGAFQDGLSGDYKLLAIKAILDGFASLAFASSLGLGVMFSSLSVLVYQGTLTLLAHQLQSLVTPTMTNEMSAVGGVILVGIAIGSLLEIRPIRSGNFLPALFIAPIVVAILEMLGVHF